MLVDIYTHNGGLGAFSGAGLVGLAVAFLTLRRVRRWRKVLAERPWQGFGVEYLPERWGGAAGLLLASESGPTPSVVPLRINEVKWRQEGLSGEACVWVCGDTAGSVVVAAPQTRALYAASSPSGYLGHKWVKAHKEELAARGLHLAEDVKKPWLWVSIGLWSACVLMLTAAVGFLVQVAEGHLDRWPGVAICTLLSASIAWLSTRSWSKIA
ncbi:MAG TPA: hypothetical protein VEJ23_01085 [Solirubrobacteraceae bacterium]|nr:hypothetical protein [Solirubrobacteraceae bacterium]